MPYAAGQPYRDFEAVTVPYAAGPPLWDDDTTVVIDPAEMRMTAEAMMFLDTRVIELPAPPQPAPKPSVRSAKKRRTRKAP